MFQSPSTAKLGQGLIISLWSIGAIAVLTGFAGFFYSWLIILLLVPVGILLSGVFLHCKLLAKFSKTEKIILGLILIWWFLHSLQVFTPETGFDALWYHLPLAKIVTSNHRFVGDPNFYQSFNPQFSDSIFYLGYTALGELGPKLVAYLFGISLIFSSYLLSRKFLNRTYSLLAVLLISSFQVVSWQVSSFYIDVAKAFWEVSALYFLLEKCSHSTIKSSLLFGASLASKFFSIALLPTMAASVIIQKNWKAARNFIFLSLLIAGPFYYFSYAVSGNPFYSVFEHVSKLAQIGGSANPLNYIFLKTLQLPLLPFEVFFTREYTTPMLILLFPLLLISWKKINNDNQLKNLALFTLTQLLMWWYLPPLSVRYALSGFVTAAILLLILLTSWWKQKKLNQKWLVAGLIVTSLIFLPVRLAIAIRSSHYLLGQQTKEEYLEQFLDGNVDEVLKKWHKL